MSLLKSMFWRTFYARWNSPTEQLQPGYSLLLMVPGDLPVFLRLAMDVCAKQDLTHLREALVIPDHLSPQLLQRWEHLKKDWPGGNIRMVPLHRLDRILTSRYNDPHINCWLQLIRGVEQAKTTHALWHDADLFITNPAMLRELYETASSGNKACWGIDPQSPIFWDWYHDRGINHIVASYEMMMDVQWFRSFKPWEHRSPVTWKGETHQGDITYCPQVKTDPSRNGWKQRPEDFVHFSYVIGTYRWFQRAFRQNHSFADERFCLLLVRFLIDVFDPTDWPYEVPDLPTLTEGLTDSSAPVTFMSENNPSRYPTFRATLTRLLQCGLLDDAQRTIIEQGIIPFDQAFAEESPSVA